MELRNSKTVPTEFGELSCTLPGPGRRYRALRPDPGEIREDVDTLVRVQTINTLRDVLGTQIEGSDAVAGPIVGRCSVLPSICAGAVVLIGQAPAPSSPGGGSERFPAPPGVADRPVRRASRTTA